LSAAEVGIRQAIFLERARRILASSILQDTVTKLLAQLARLAEPTAFFVTQHLIRIYLHLLEQSPSREKRAHLRWVPKADGKLEPELELDLRKPQSHVRETLVEGTIADQKLIEKLVDQALNATCAWFAKDLEAKFDLDRLTEIPESALAEAYLQFLTENAGTPADRLTYLITLCAQNLAQGLAETMEPTLREANLHQVEQLLGLRKGSPLPKIAPASQVQEFLEVMNSSHYHAVRDALARKSFIQTEDSPWPTATIDKGHAKGYAELRPAEMDLHTFLPPDQEKFWVDRMWKQREELSDLDADALDALSSIWLGQAKGIDQDAVAGVDQILEMRGVLPKKGGTGRRGGYHQQQRTEILLALSHIQNLWMNMTQMEIYDEAPNGKRKGKPKIMAVKSRAFTITDMMGQLRLDGHMDVSRFIFRPGKVFASFLFGIGRQTALLSARALRYDPYRQAGEKRMTRYLSWQWRCQANSGCGPKAYRVDTLLEAIGETASERHPNRTRDRLEKLLDTLHQDQVIAGWQYDRWSEQTAASRGWVHPWLEATLLLEPPAAIQDRYVRLARVEPALSAPVSSLVDLGEKVRLKRLALGLSQVQLGEQLEIDRSALNRLELGLREGSKANRKKLEAWLLSQI